MLKTLAVITTQPLTPRRTIWFAMGLLVVASSLHAQDTRPLEPADRRVIPAAQADVDRLLQSLRWTIEVSDQKQTEEFSGTRADLIETLKSQVKNLQALVDVRATLLLNAAASTKALSDAIEFEKQIAIRKQQELDPIGLPDPTADDAEERLQRERATAEAAVEAVRKYREKCSKDRDDLKSDLDSAQAKPAEAEQSLAEARKDLEGAESDAKAALTGGADGEILRLVQEKVFLQKIRVARFQAEVDRWSHAIGKNREARLRAADLRVDYEDQKLRTWDARRRKTGVLLDQAYESRLQRVLTEQSTLDVLLATLPPWAQPYWLDKRLLANLRVEATRLDKARKVWDARVGVGGEIAVAKDEADSDKRSFDEVDSGAHAIEDVTSGTVRGLTVIIEVREATRDRMHQLQEELRKLLLETREQLRAAQALRPDLLVEQVENDRKRGAPPADAKPDTPETRDAANPRAWDQLATDLRAAAAARLEKLQGLTNLLTVAGKTLGATRADAEKNLIRYQRALRWTRDESDISIESIRQAFEDSKSISEVVQRAAIGSIGGVRDYFTSRVSEGRVSEIVKLALALAAVIGLAIAAHHFSSKTYSFDDKEWAEKGVFGGIRHILTYLVRSTEITLVIAFAGVALPALAGANEATIKVVAILCGTPFAFRLARTLLDLLFGADEKAPRLLPTRDRIARLCHGTIVLLLRVWVVIVPVALLLTVTPYRARNPGIVELLWLINTVLSSLIILSVMARPSVLMSLFKGESDAALSFKALVLVAYPSIVGAVIYLMVLHSLSYRVAARYFLDRFLTTAGWLLAAWIAAGWLARLFFRGTPPVERPELDLGLDEAEFLARGRAHLGDRIRRLAIKLAVYGPAVWFTLDHWGLTGAGWDAAFDQKMNWISPNLTLGNVVNAVITTALAVFIIRLNRDLLRFVLLPRTRLDRGLQYTIVTLATYTLIALFGILVLGGQLRVDATQIGWFIGALGVGVGFGLQEIINNFVSGIILLVERPLKVGDTISVDGVVGRVDRINMRSTTVMTPENTGLIVPNRDLISTKVSNWSAGTPTIRATLPIGVAYGTDVAKFRTIVMGIVEKHTLVLRHPAYDVFFVGFGASSLDFELRYWLRLSTNGAKVKSELLFALDLAFRAQGIEIPFPRQDVHLYPETPLVTRDERSAPPPIAGGATPTIAPAAPLHHREPDPRTSED